MKSPLLHLIIFSIRHTYGEIFMTISILLAQQIAQLFLMIFMGFLIVKAGLLKDEDSKVLSKIVLYLIIPCVILNAFQVDYTPETVRGLLVAFAASLLMQVVLLFAVSALGRVFHLDAVEITSVYYSNSGNLIVPLVTAVLGAEWVLYSCVYMSVQLVFFWTHCKKVISREASYDWKKIVLNLNIISIFVGILLFFTGIRLPALVNNTLHSVGSMVGPASMIVTGMLFAGMDFRQIFANKRIYFVTFLRLIAVPLMALVLLKISHLADLSADGPTLILIVFLAVITPSASTVTQMCQVYGNDSRYASAINVVTTLASIVTMPLLVMLLQMILYSQLTEKRCPASPSREALTAFSITQLIPFSLQTQIHNAGFFLLGFPVLSVPRRISLFQSAPVLFVPFPAAFFLPFLLL